VLFQLTGGFAESWPLIRKNDRGKMMVTNGTGQQKQKDLDKTIGRRLREKRLKRGFTLAEVSAKVGISYQQIQKYEQAVSKISASTLFKLSALYCVRVERFFDGLDELSNGNGTPSDKWILNLLLIEDNPLDESMTRQALGENVNVFCVHDGSQTMEFLRYKTLRPDFPRPELIFLDLQLPRGNGLTVLKDIKRDSRIQDIPVVILTNNIGKHLIAEAYKHGASGYICKSFDFATFRENITDCVKYWTKAVVLPSAQHGPQI
jgi:CheY-like chemotaxis protein